MISQLSFDLNTDIHFLSNAFEHILDRAISEEPMEVNGVEVVLKRNGPALVVAEEKVIDIECPVEIHLKRPAGLFTVEGSGSLVLNILVAFDVSSQLLLSTKTTLNGHRWISKPVLEIGALNLPIETLVDLILNHHESILTASIDSAIKEKGRLKPIISDKLKEVLGQINEKLPYGQSLSIELEKIALSDIIRAQDQLKVVGQVFGVVGVNQKLNKGDIVFEWVENPVSKGNLQVVGSVGYNIITDMIQDKLKGVDVAGRQFVIDDITIEAKDFMTVKMQISEPIHAEVLVQMKPVLNELEQKVFIQNVDVKVNPANFIYKMTAPLVNKYVENQINNWSPIPLSEIFKKQVLSQVPDKLHIDELGEVQILIDQIRVNQLDFKNNQIAFEGNLEQLHLILKTG